MVEVSKHLFEETCKHMECYTMMHPWHTNCLKAGIDCYKNAFIGSYKFYSIIYLAQIMMRGKKMFSKKEWIKMFEYYVRSGLLGFLICGSACSLGCMLRALCGGKFGYYSYIMIPNTLNGVAIFLEPPSRRGLVINLFSNLVIEYWIRTLERAGYFNMTTSRQTLLFMLGSSALFYLMRLEGDRKERTALFWLFTPEKVRRKSDNSKNVCPHDGPCWSHVLKGFLKLFGIGFCIAFARAVLPKIRRPLTALSSLRPQHLRMAMFFGSYIGIYRAIVCLLCRRQGADSALYALPAGYLAGLSLYFNPNLGISIAAATGAFKLLSTILYERKLITEKVPLPELTFCICQGILYHARFMHPEVCPKYIFNLMKTVSNGCTEMLYSGMIDTIKKAKHI